MDGQHKIRGGPLYWLERRARRFWIIAVVLMPVLYVASLGPWCWISSRTYGDSCNFPKFYIPIIWVRDWDLRHRPEHQHILNALEWYSGVGADGEWLWFGRGADSRWGRVKRSPIE